MSAVLHHVHSYGNQFGPVLRVVWTLNGQNNGASKRREGWFSCWVCEFGDNEVINDVINANCNARFWPLGSTRERYKQTYKGSTQDKIQSSISLSICVHTC